MIKWYGKDISEGELIDTIAHKIPSDYTGKVTEWLVNGIKDVALSKEEKVFKVTYRPFMATAEAIFAGDPQIKFVKAKDYVDAQDQVSMSSSCEIINIEEEK